MPKILFGTFLAVTSLIFVAACNSATDSRKRDDIHNIDDPRDSSYYMIYDSASERFHRVSNLLEFLARDTMKTDSTYVATLAIARDISPVELERAIQDVVDPESEVMVQDTTQEVTMQMSAVLEDRSSPTDPNFHIRLIGSSSNVRTFDPRKGRMIWQWNVTPLKQGHHELLLSISQVDENDRIIGSPETRRHSIIIFSEKKKAGVFRGIGSFFANNWQWLIAAVVLPVFIAWFTTRLKRNWEKKGG